MSAFASSSSPPFLADLAEGLAAPRKHIETRYLFDAVGMALYDILATLPEYGMARGEERIFRRYSTECRKLAGPVSLVAEIGRGNNKAAVHLLCSFGTGEPQVAGAKSRAPVIDAAGWLSTARQLLSNRRRSEPVVLTLLGGYAGSLDRGCFLTFLEDLRALLLKGDCFLFGVDLIKDIDKMISSYQDPAGITSAFNKSLLSRINRESGGRFDLRTFEHKVTWNTLARCIELELRSRVAQSVYVGSLGRRFQFEAGETIRTLRDFKYAELELELLARKTGFHLVKTMVDVESAFADLLWRV